jgi:hypothetical protein
LDCPTHAGREAFRTVGGMKTTRVAASILSLNPPARRHRSILGTDGVWGSVERFSESIQGTVFSFESNGKGDAVGILSIRPVFFRPDFRIDSHPSPLARDRRTVLENDCLKRPGKVVVGRENTGRLEKWKPVEKVEKSGGDRLPRRAAAQREEAGALGR